MARSSIWPKGWQLRAGHLAAGLCILALAWAAAWGWGAHNRTQAQTRFDELAQHSTRLLIHQIEGYEKAVRSARGVVSAAGEHGIARSTFRRYQESRDMEREFPGARGFGFIRRVPALAESAFVRAARADGWPEFAVRQLTAHDGERYVIQYIEPVQPSRQAVGLDIASEADRKEAAERAMRTGEATLTAPITLVEESGKTEHAFLLLLPVYRPVGAPRTAAERMEATFGWTYMPLVIDEVIARANVREDLIELSLGDIGATGESREFYASPGAAHGEGVAPRPMTRSVAPVFGRQWEIRARARPAFVAQLDQVQPHTVFTQVVAMGVLAACSAGR